MKQKVSKKDVVLVIIGILLTLVSCWIFKGLLGFLCTGDIQAVLCTLLVIIFLGGCGGSYLVLEKRVGRYEFLLLDMMIGILLLFLAVWHDVPSCVARLMDGSLMLVSNWFQDVNGWRGQIARFLSALNVSCNILIVALFGLVVWQFVKRIVMRRCRNACDEAVKWLGKQGRSLFACVLKAQRRETV